MKTAKYMLAIALSVVTLVARPAHATDITTTYTINFTTTSGSPSPLSGSFTYDSTTPQFSNFIVMWNGFTYNLTAAANSPLAPEFGPTGCTGEASNAAYSFLLLSQQLTGCTPSYRWQALDRVNSTGDAVNNFVFVASTSGGNDEILLPRSLPPSDTPFFAEGSWSLTAQQSAVPEPSSVLLLGTGLFGMLGAVRRKLIS